MSDFETTTAADLQERLAEGEIPHFWNVLTDDYFGGEIIPGSRRVPVDTVVREAKSLGLTPEAEIVVYCSGPDCPQSTAAAEKLAASGFENVRAFEGGLSAWKEAGQPVRAVAEATVGD